MAKLIIRNMAGEDREFPLSDRDLRVGRGEQNDVVLPDPEKAVSRFHAELRYESGTYVLVDANSPNGVWVNGRREAEVELQPGVEAMIGPYTLRIEHGAPATETVAVSAPTIVSTGATPVPTRATALPTATATHAKTQLPANTSPPKTTAAKGPLLPPNAVWIAAVAALLVIATVVAAVGIRRRAQRMAHAREVAAEEIKAQQDNDARRREEDARRQQEEQVRQHLEEAQRLFDSHQFEAANGEIGRVNELDPSNADAAQLREKIQAALSTPPPTASAASHPTQQPGQAPGRGLGQVVNLPPGAAADSKPKALQDRYDQGKQALLNGDYQKAISLLEALLRDDPNYRDGAFLLGQSKLAVQRDDALANAKKAEASGDLPTALKLYLDAQKAGAANQEDVNRVRATMTRIGADSFDKARAYYAYRQFDKALPAYQRAYDYLPENDPNRKIAKDKLDELAARGRGSRNTSPTDK